MLSIRSRQWSAVSYLEYLKTWNHAIPPKNAAWLILIIIWCTCAHSFILRITKHSFKLWNFFQQAKDNDSIVFSVVENWCRLHWNVLFSVSTCLKLQVICSAKENHYNKILHFILQYHSMCLNWSFKNIKVKCGLHFSNLMQDW